MKLLNAFSLNMIAARKAAVVITPISATRAAEIAAKDIHSCVGHADTAAVFAGVLGVAVEARRETVIMHDGEAVLVGQYIGPRLPEGAVSLPEGAEIQWRIVSVHYAD